MNCPCAHAATRRRPGCAGSHSAHFVRASRGPNPTRLTPFEPRGGPFNFIAPGRQSLPFAYGGTGRRPTFGGSRGGARTPFTHRRVPQGPASSSQSELDSPLGSLRSSLAGTPLISYSLGEMNSPARYARPRASHLRWVPGRGIGYVLGVFWYFLSLVTKSTAFIPPQPVRNEADAGAFSSFWKVREARGTWPRTAHAAARSRLCPRRAAYRAPPRTGVSGVCRAAGSAPRRPA